MQVTRRSLLYLLGALPFAQATRSLASGAGLGGAAKPQASSDSIFVLFEGPWLISHTAKQHGITALTVEDTQHTVASGKWDDKSKSMVTANLLDPGTSCAITGSNLATAPPFGELFNNACASHKIAWISRVPHTLHPTGAQRRIDLPMPNRVYVAGFLVNTKVSNKSQPVLDTNDVVPHVTTVLEYERAAQGAPGMSLAIAGKPAQTLGAGDHMIFRTLLGDPTCPDNTHVQHAFNFLADRVQAGTTPGPIQIACQTTDYQTGSCAPTFSDNELGLEQSTCGARVKAKVKLQGIHIMERYANCAGATIIAG